jgi:hypothetical protein
LVTGVEWKVIERSNYASQYYYPRFCPCWHFQLYLCDTATILSTESFFFMQKIWAQILPKTNTLSGSSEQHSPIYKKTGIIYMKTMNSALPKD